MMSKIRVLRYPSHGKPPSEIRDLWSYLHPPYTIESKKRTTVSYSGLRSNTTLWLLLLQSLRHHDLSARVRQGTCFPGQRRGPLTRTLALATSSNPSFSEAGRIPVGTLYATRCDGQSLADNPVTGRITPHHRQTPL